MKRIVLFCVLCVLLSGQDVGSSPAFVVALSEEAAHQIESETGIISDPLLLDRIQPIVQSIMNASDIRQVFPCRILDTDEVNAFALPAGPVYVTMGLLDLLDSLKTEEDVSALAGIVGHEIAHIYNRHYVAWVRLEQYMTEPDVVPSDIASLLALGYKRKQEFEADEYGVMFAMRAGYDFESIVRFYKKIREVYGDVPPGDEEYLDHPRITERIAHLYEIRAQLEHDFDRFNFGVKALAQGDYSEAVLHFRAFTSTFSNSALGWSNLGAAYLYQATEKMKDVPVMYMITYYTEPDFVLRGTPEELFMAQQAYKRAADIDTTYNIVYHGNMSIIEALNGNFDDAISHAEKAIEGEEAEHVFFNSLGNALFLNRQYKDAIKAYSAALEHREEWLIPRYNMALSFERLGEEKSAIDQWEILLETSAFSAVALDHLAQLGIECDVQGKDIEVETALGEVHIDMEVEDVMTQLGEPDQRTMIESMTALEYYGYCMVVIVRKGTVTAIITIPGYEGTTEKGIGLGSSTVALRNAYGLPDDIVVQKSSDQWVYNMYGLLFTVIDDEVSEFQVVKVGKK